MVIKDIHLLNPPNHHIEVDSCMNVRVDRFTATAPHDSPNSDGINFYGGFDQSLTNSIISNGDDCISVVPVNLGAAFCLQRPEPDRQRCRGGHVVVTNVSCIGSHGVSIGGIRNGYVNNVTFSDLRATGVPFDTQGKYSPGGLRIKSYPNGTGSVTDIHFSNIDIYHVYLAIEIQSIYCPKGGCAAGNSAVKFDNITFSNVTSNTHRSQKADFACSALSPCTGIVLDNVDLGAGGVADCSYADVQFVGKSTPAQCTAT